MRKPLERILCATDFSEVSRSVVPYGIEMAKKLSAKLYICHIIDLPAISVYGESVFDPISHQQYFIDFARKEMENQVAGEDIDWEPLISIGQTPDEIVRLVVENNIDMVVTSTHGRSGLRRLFLGSVTERLMRTLTCPLLVLPSEDTADEDQLRRRFPFRNILVAYDFSKDSEQAFSTSLSIAQEFESNLHIVHVVEPTAYKDFLKFPGAPGEPLPRDIHDSLKEGLLELVPMEAFNWCEIQAEILVGKPYAEIVSYAGEKGIDLIALGVRGHGKVEEVLVGSTTDRVIRRAPCPVLSVLPA
ncbi:MAG: universal stress protein [Desulfosalsimonadaceae bacterium]